MYLHLLIATYFGALVSPGLCLPVILAILCYWALTAWRARSARLPLRTLAWQEALAVGERALKRKAAKPSSDRRVSIQVQKGWLRGVLAEPSQGTASDIGVIVTHPWAAMGGSMENNVPLVLSRAFASMGHPSLRVDLRGSGLGRGNGAVAELGAAARYLLSADCGVRRVILVGYSHGSVVAGAAAGNLGEELAGLVTISPPWPWAWLLFLGNQRALIQASRIRRPKLFLLGSWDIFLPPSFWRTELAEFPAPLSAVLMEGCGHFWTGAELCLVGQIVEWMEKTL